MDSLILENIDSNFINSIEIISNNENNLYNVDGIIKTVINPNCQTIDDTVYSVYKYLKDNHMYFNVPELNSSELWQVQKNLGIYGYGHCGTINYRSHAILQKIFNEFSVSWENGHGWTEAKSGKRKFFLDSDRGLIIKDIDNKSYIGFGEYIEDRALGFRNTMIDLPSNIQYSNSISIYRQLSAFAENSGYYPNINNNINDGLTAFHDLYYSLYPDEKLKIITGTATRFHHRNYSNYNANLDSSNVLSIIKSGEYFQDFNKNPQLLNNKVFNLNNIFINNNELKVNSTNSQLIFGKKSKFLFTEINLNLKAQINNNEDSINVYFSLDSINWIKKYTLNFSSDSINESILSFLENNSQPAIYNYFIKLEIYSKDSNLIITKLNTTSYFQQSIYITPSLNLGSNEILIKRDNINSKLISKFYWKESSNNSIPQSPQYPIYPLNNTIVNNTNIDFEWQPIYTNPIGDSIVEWHFQFSEFPDFRSVILNQFDHINYRDNSKILNKYLHKDYQLLGVSDFFINNKKYYWRVKLRDKNNICSEWSPTWNFTAVVPMHPNNLHFELTNSDDSLKLVWSKNNEDSSSFKTFIFRSENNYIGTYKNSWSILIDSVFLDSTYTINKNNYQGNIFRICALDSFNQSTPSRVLDSPN